MLQRLVALKASRRCESSRVTIIINNKSFNRWTGQTRLKNKIQTVRKRALVNSLRYCKERVGELLLKNST